jgi:hypothetical protein
MVIVLRLERAPTQSYVCRQFEGQEGRYDQAFYRLFRRKVEWWQCSPRCNIIARSMVTIKQVAAEGDPLEVVEVLKTRRVKEEDDQYGANEIDKVPPRDAGHPVYRDKSGAATIMPAILVYPDGSCCHALRICAVVRHAGCPASLEMTLVPLILMLLKFFPFRLRLTYTTLRSFLIPYGLTDAISKCA